MMDETYEEVLQYNVYDAIELKAGKPQRKLGFDGFYHDNSPANIPNHPSLTDKEWLYEHVEYLFIHDMFNYQRCQGPKEYYLLFKTLIEKYNIEEDYQKYSDCNGLEFGTFKSKWEKFAIQFVDFLAHAFDHNGVLEDLFSRTDFVDYFFRYPKIYTYEVLRDFGYIGISKLLNYEEFSSYYLEHPDELIHLMRNNPKLEVPAKLFSDKRFQKIAHDINVENFYFNMNFVWENSSGIHCLEEHQRFCDYQMTHANHGILPSLRKEYESSPENVTEDDEDDLEWYLNPLKEQVIQRIFELYNEKSIPKLLFYQKLSKYIAVGLLISRYFETSPYNLLIDIRTLYEFATKHKRKLEGDYIYEFLINFEKFDIFDIIDFYQKVKDLPLKDILYDDWEEQKNKFVEEVNRNMIQPEVLVSKNSDYGVPYYDISDLENPIVVHNTGIAIDNFHAIDRMIDCIENCIGNSLCLSLQDLKHQIFYEKTPKHTIKFIYGTLDPSRVGIIFHSDAYSQGLMEVEYENAYYKRRLYTLEEFMMLTNNGYNEIVYSIDQPMKPLGILCEEEPTSEEIRVVQELNISIFYRPKKYNDKVPSSNEKRLTQRYGWRTTDMNLFPKEK